MNWLQRQVTRVLPAKPLPAPALHRPGRCFLPPAGRLLRTWAAIAFLSTGCSAAIAVWTHQYDNSRAGANTSETSLSVSNVNSSSFGKVFSCQVDGSIYAQPLLVPALTVNGSSHNVVFVATAAKSLYAFDADNGAQLWHHYFGTPPPGSDLEVNPDIVGPVGIIGTPVINTSTNTIYLVERNKNPDGTYHQFLRALDLATGVDKFGSPHEISAAFGSLTFDPKIQNQRVAVTLVGDTVYIGWGSHNDLQDWHGWLIGYLDSDVTNQRYVFSASAAVGNKNGLWMSGEGFSADGLNNLYLITGNGLFDGSGNYGDSVLKLNPSLSVQDYFSPSNSASLDSNDLDLGSSGALLVPDTTDVVGGGKDGRLFLLNTDNLGKFNASTDQVLQEFQASNGEIHSYVYWGGSGAGPAIYVWGENDKGKAFPFAGALLKTTPSSTTALTGPSGGSGSLAISSNGSKTGTGILWANTPGGDANRGTVTGTLHAYDATNLATELWNSSQNAARDNYGNFAKFCPPVVANGKVYMATFSNQLVVYGELNEVVPAAPTNLTAVAGNSQVSLSWGASSGAMSYNVYRGTTPGGEASTPIATGVSGVSYTAAALTNGVAYYFTVRAVNNTGTSTPSNEAGAQPDATLVDTEVDLSSASNVIAIYNDGVTFASNGGLDNGGAALSATLIGTNQTWNGVPFTIGAAGLDDVVSGSTPIPLPAGNYSSLEVLATSVNGDQPSQVFTVRYSDGTASTFTQSLSDWYTPASYSGETKVVPMSYRNLANGSRDNRTFYVCGYSFPINSAKTLVSFSLPNNANVKLLPSR